MTNRISQTFQWYADFSTSPERMQVIKITCGGERTRRRLLPFFGAFKYYKLGSVDVKFVPASTLPVDPTGLSLEAGENTVDPRDQFNPGLVRITNGEDFWEDFPSGDTNKADALYYQMMLDQRWYKFNLQSGFRRSATPRYWTVGQFHQDVFPGFITNVPSFTKETGPPVSVHNFDTDHLKYQVENNDRLYNVSQGSSPYSLFQTGNKGTLGWLTTDNFLNVDSNYDRMCIADVPEVELMRVILPKAYKTKFYYRIYVSETVYFKEPVTMNAASYAIGTSPETYGYLTNSLDRFVFSRTEGVGTPSPYALATIQSQWHNDAHPGGVN
ncbi:capsid protein [Chicken associated huchismacovirus 2]|uniref:Capsid protein n=1 Tax=Chicken associated huchismacovirus 2 TaxID=2169933 RepID=A0A1L6KWC2_9VIRU|nr:capsid protein [Chicken associated huchismacovirus 2]APR73546.1 capsid protein [Chicken associated huchismacovirus 2]